MFRMTPPCHHARGSRLPPYVFLRAKIKINIGSRLLLVVAATFDNLKLASLEMVPIVVGMQAQPSHRQFARVRQRNYGKMLIVI